MAVSRSVTFIVTFGIAADAAFTRASQMGEPQRMPTMTAPPEATEAAVFMNLLPSTIISAPAAVDRKQNKSLLTQGSNRGTRDDVAFKKDAQQEGNINATMVGGGVRAVPAGIGPGTIRNRIWTSLQYLTIGAIVKVSCIVGNILSQLSPYPSVKKFLSKGDTGDFDALPLVSIGFNGLQWCFYGLFAWWITGNHAFMILLYANVCGAISGSFYTYSFHHLCRSEKGFRWLCRYYNVIVGILLVQVLAALALPMRQAMFFEGFMASFCSVAVTISPIACLPTVLRTGSTEAMPVELAFVSFVSSVLWLTCGVMLRDWWIIIPNIVGILAGMVAMALLIIYPNKARMSRPSETTPLSAEAAGSVGKDFQDDGCTGGTGGTPSCGLVDGVDEASSREQENRAIPHTLL